MEHRIVFLDRATLAAELPAPAFRHTWVEYPYTPPGAVGEALADATIAITNKAPITRAALEAAPRLLPPMWPGRAARPCRPWASSLSG